MPRPPDGYESAKIVRREPPPPAIPKPTIGSGGPTIPKVSAAPGGAAIVRRSISDDGEPQRRPSPIKIGGGSGGPAPRPAGGIGGFPSSRPSGDGPRRPPAGDGGGGFRVGRTPEIEVGVDLVGGKGAWREDGKVKEKDKEKDKKRSFLNLETDEPVLKRQPKQRRDQLNLRSLLNQADSLDDEAEPEVEAEPVPEVEDRRRTVYTPQASHRKKDIKRRKDLKKTQLTTPRASYRVVKMGSEITVGELARQLSVKATDLIKKLMGQGVMATINQPVDFDTATLIASEYSFEVKSNVVSIEDILSDKRKAHDTAELVERPPIVTIMGHVDHGKTSILDAIRKAKVAASEAGGITQHIGAYTVEKDGRRIAFLDTPGHEAFSSMRARGAKVTDIVVLVVAADDGVMPQTVEAISHARAGGVPIIVAINKIDKPNKNLDRINAELAEHGIQSEEWGGENQFVKVSALQGIGIDDLLEAILLQSEVLELKSPLDVPASGVVVEAHLDKGRGPVATIMVQKGILRVGDHVVVGTAVGRVRAMSDHTGKRLKEAGPSTPVEVVGLSSVPMAGDQVDAVEDEKTSREVADWRKDIEMRQAQSRSSAASLDQLLAKVKAADTPEVPVIIKADTQGSVEAIAEAITKLNSDRVRNRIVHKAVGGINESDITLAATSGAVICGFNVRAARGLDDMAEKQGTLIKYFSVIYDIVDTLKSVMAGKLPPIQKEVIQGHAEVRQTIKVPKFGIVAGTSVLDGKITRNAQLRLIRNDVVIYSGKIGSLRRFKDDVREVAQGYECGIGIEGFNDIREGDVIETFIIEEHAPVL
jgi:translation initiation factor IF-2